MGNWVLRKKHSKVYLCSCFKKALENAITEYICECGTIYRTWDYKNDFINVFGTSAPIALGEIFRKSWSCKTVKEGISSFYFKDKLCHECNQAVPNLLYCKQMYGRTHFEAEYGWYISKSANELGVNFNNWHLMKKIASDKILDRIEIEFSEIDEAFEPYKKALENDDFIQKREAWDSWVNFIDEHFHYDSWLPENEARKRFGFKEKGHSSMGETSLYNLVKNVFPNHKVERHYRGKWLDRLELDIFVHELNLGIEYQGEQHFQAVEHWGGEEALKKGQARDEKKKYLCEVNKVALEYFYFNEVLTDEIVKKRLKKYIK